MPWYREGTVTATTGSKAVTGVGTFWDTIVEPGDIFVKLDANGLPTGKFYEVDRLIRDASDPQLGSGGAWNGQDPNPNTMMMLKQAIQSADVISAGTYAILNTTGEMTTPRFAARLQNYIETARSLNSKPNVTAQPGGIPIADGNGKIAAGWLPELPAASTSAVGVALVPTRLYARSAKFARASAYTLSTPAVNVEVNGALLSFAAGTIGLNTAANWDASTYATPANRAGGNFYVYATSNGLILSANATYPTGYTASTSRKIGGFHCLCVAVGTISGHPLSGFLAGDILPASVWDLQHRPLCSPEGMVWSEAAGIWVDIYLQSGTGTLTKSANGGTITDTRIWMDFVDDLGAVGKRLLDDGEFQKVAEGCNKETNIAGSVDPGTTTGHTDTAGRRMISNIGCEDCAGVVYQWLLDQSYRVGTGAAWSWYDLPGDKGSLYNYSTDGTADVKLLAGGPWYNGVYCGSRCRYAAYHRWATPSASTIGARGCCGAM